MFVKRELAQKDYMTQRRVRTKLMAKADGPYQVVGSTDHTVTILRDGLRDTVTRDRVSKLHRGARVANPPQAQSEPTPEGEETTEATQGTAGLSEQPTSSGERNDGNEPSTVQSGPQADLGDLSTQKLPYFRQGVEPFNTRAVESANLRPSEGSGTVVPQRTTVTPPTSGREATHSPFTRMRRRVIPSEPPMMRATENSLNQEFSVDKLVDWDSATNRYRVRRTGYAPSRDTWEPAEHLPYNLLVRFYRKRGEPIPRGIRHLDRWPLQGVKAAGNRHGWRTLTTVGASAPSGWVSQG